MAIFSDHPYSSITVKIDQLANPPNDEIENSLELYVSDLLHLIKIQPSSGSIEAARAIRKRIKYGDTVDEQIRAMNILELLILNSGSKIGPVIANDSKLLDVLKGAINGTGKTGVGLPFDNQVQTRARQLAVGWKGELQDLDGYKYMAGLWKNIPRKKTHNRSRSRPEEIEEPVDAFADEAGVRSPSPSSPAMQRNRPRRPVKKAPPRPLSPSPYTSSSKPKSKKKKKKSRHGVVYADEQYKIPQINYKVEAPNIRNALAESQTHTTAMNNLLISLPSGTSPLDDAKVQKEFEACKKVRRKVLKYLQFVGAGDPSEKTEAVLQMDEEFLGSLIAANEQLVDTFKRYDFLAGYTEENPAPNYDDESSGESYYTSESEYDDEIDLVADAVQASSLGEGSSTPKSPPPRPAKPAALKPPQLFRSDTNATTGTTGTVSSDPFGDGNEVDKSKSVYD